MVAVWTGGPRGGANLVIDSGVLSLYKGRVGGSVVHSQLTNTAHTVHRGRLTRRVHLARSSRCNHNQKLMNTTSKIFARMFALNISYKVELFK